MDRESGLTCDFAVQHYEYVWFEFIGIVVKHSVID